MVWGSNIFTVVALLRRLSQNKGGSKLQDFGADVSVRVNAELAAGDMPVDVSGTKRGCCFVRPKPTAALSPVGLVGSNRIL